MYSITVLSDFTLHSNSQKVFSIESLSYVYFFLHYVFIVIVMISKVEVNQCYRSVSFACGITSLSGHDSVVFNSKTIYFGFKMP